MKNVFFALVATMTLASVAYAYQVTGPVLDVSDSKIVVEKDKAPWTIARDKTTKGATDIKKGDKVTVEYTMSATNIDVKAAAKAKK